eukprot:12248105-Heterocapsa_arctica.AAC.1
MEIRPGSMETETGNDVRPDQEEREAHRVFPESDDLEAATRDTSEVLRQLEPPMAQAGGSSGQ